MEDVKLVAESLQEFEQIDEGIVDFFTGARTAVSRALKNPENEKIVNNAVRIAFAKQFGSQPKVKEAILGWKIEKKIELLKLAAKRLEDKKIAFLAIVKKPDGTLTVAGTQAAGGALSAVTGA